MKYALKCISIQEMSKKNYLERLRNEINILNILRGSEYIANLFDCFEDQSYVYLVNDYLDGVAAA